MMIVIVFKNYVYIHKFFVSMNLLLIIRDFKQGNIFLYVCMYIQWGYLIYDRFIHFNFNYSGLRIFT